MPKLVLVAFASFMVEKVRQMDVMHGLFTVRPATTITSPAAGAATRPVAAAAALAALAVTAATVTVATAAVADAAADAAAVDSPAVAADAFVHLHASLHDAD